MITSIHAASPSAIADRIQGMLRSFGPFRFSDVAVRPSAGGVTLYGTTPNFFAKSLAYQLAQSAAVGHRIVDSLTVLEPSRRDRSRADVVWAESFDAVDTLRRPPVQPSVRSVAATAAG
jgi:hypothetical protein